MTKRIRIDVISDTVCPWCYVGKRRVEKAMRNLQSKNSGVEFDLVWHPYQLNPDAPKSGINKREYYKQKFGTGRASSIIESMTETFANEGLQYQMDGLTGNTFNSHRLIAHAGKEGTEKQNALVDELFKAYFTQGKYINDKGVLLEAAKAAGVTDAEAVVEDETIEAKEVSRELASVRGAINGVPHFIIDNKFALSGAQDPATFESVFEKVL